MPALANAAVSGAARFRRDGFGVIPGFLGRDELHALRQDVAAVLEAPLPPGCERPHNTLAPLRWDDRVVDRVLSCEARRAALREALDADDLRWISAYVSVKEPQSESLWWHQDWWCWDHPVAYRPDPPQVGVLCYLSDTCANSGALRVIPGTHLRSIALHAELPEAHSRSVGDLAPSDAAMCDHPGQVTLAVHAGDAVVTDYRLLHGTHPNATGRRRECLIVTFAPSWRRLHDEIRAHLIRHPALPWPDAPDLSWAELLPEYEGRPRDLPLSRAAPSVFAASRA